MRIYIILFISWCLSLVLSIVESYHLPTSPTSRIGHLGAGRSFLNTVAIFYGSTAAFPFPTMSGTPDPDIFTRSAKDFPWISWGTWEISMHF